jgi:hypothetical protein
MWFTVDWCVFGFCFVWSCDTLACVNMRGNGQIGMSKIGKQTPLAKIDNGVCLRKVPSEQILGLCLSILENLFLLLFILRQLQRATRRNRKSISFFLRIKIILADTVIG